MHSRAGVHWLRSVPLEFDRLEVPALNQLGELLRLNPANADQLVRVEGVVLARLAGGGAERGVLAEHRTRLLPQDVRDEVEFGLRPGAALISVYIGVDAGREHEDGGEEEWNYQEHAQCDTGKWHVFHEANQAGESEAGEHYSRNHRVVVVIDMDPAPPQ